MARTTKKKAASSDSAPQADEPQSIDAMLDGLEGVVAELESGELPLEDALKRFEEGVRLARRGEQALGAVEERIETLLADGETTEPFSTTADADDADAG